MGWQAGRKANSKYVGKQIKTRPQTERVGARSCLSEESLFKLMVVQKESSLKEWGEHIPENRGQQVQRP